MKHHPELYEEYTFICITCKKEFTVTPIAILRYLKNREKFCCLECIEEHPKQEFECPYCLCKFKLK